MNVIVSPKAAKQVDKLTGAEGLKITEKLHQLEQNPFSGKKLSGELKHLYSLRAWPYRIIYQILVKEKVILIVTIEHRQRVYK